MARLLQLYRRSSSSSSIIPNLLLHQKYQNPSSKFCSKPNKALPHFSTSAAAAATVVVGGGVEKSNILRILRNELDYQSHYAPPHQPVTEFNSFTVVDRPGEQWATLRGQYEEDESIKIEATMFDGSAIVPKSGYDGAGEDLHLHISLLVDITRGKGWDPLEFVCSAWPDHLEIQKVYVFKRSGSLHQPYLGPSFKDLDSKLQKAFYEFLKERGINDGLARFMHEYMLNKDRIELIGWLTKIKSFVEI